MTVSGNLIDLSSNNHPPGGPAIDYAAVARAGVIGAFVKATEGTGYTNPFYETDVAGLVGAGIPTLAYHFADFTDAAAEAAHFRAVAGSRARVLDSETSTDAAWQNTFLAALNVPWDEEVDYGSASSLPSTGIRALLWPADYGKNPGFGDCWQFTSSGSVPGIAGAVDLSTWTGSQADFDALFSIASPPPPPEEVTGMVSDVITYRPGQRDTFQVLLGVLAHYWIGSDGIPRYEPLIGPAGHSPTPKTIGTVPDQVPQVAMVLGSVNVNVELDNGHPVTCIQGLTGGWNVLDWLLNAQPVTPH